MSVPSRAQISVTRAVVRWYFDTHRGSAGDVGVPSMFMDPATVGPFAIDPNDFAAGAPDALFRLLVACSMFQRLRDQQIIRTLRSMAPHHAREISSASALLKLADSSPCKFTKSTTALRERCDLTKDAAGQGSCSVAPAVACHLKRHTVVMKRYGHFGKVPTSIALAVREADASDLSSLYQQVVQAHPTRYARAVALEAALCAAWRVHQKIASMFLSMVSNPDLPCGGGRSPWTRGIDWTYFVVVDSNVDLFLASIGYAGLKTYDARRSFVRELARGVSLRSFDRRLHDYNPRLVQQALFLFMSASNRIAAPDDCMRRDGSCSRCPNVLVDRCRVRRSSGQDGTSASLEA